MTSAICCNCGEFKFGAFCECEECGHIPKTDDDLVLSLVMTDHYFDTDALESMGLAVREGNPPSVDPQTHAEFIQLINNNDMLTRLKATGA